MLPVIRLVDVVLQRRDSSVQNVHLSLIRYRCSSRVLDDLLWSRVDKKSKFECWLWTAGKFSKGYGAFRIKGEQQTTHRVSYEMYHGPIPEGMKVCHTCDNPPCVNPEHLFLGTQKDNIQDCVKKKRIARGEKQGHSKLKEAQVRAILKDERSQREIAKTYNVAQPTISDIKRGKRWKHVGEK